jgi:hypothetical protein
LDLLLAGAAMFDQAGKAYDRSCERSKTDFGYVLVRQKYRQAAIGEGVAAKAKAESELGLSNINFAILDEKCGKHGWDEPDENNIIVYPWAFGEAVPSKAPPPEVQVLRHEIGHSLFIRFLIPSTRAIQYGGDAPDWLDEMAAVSFESPGNRAMRRCELSLYARTTGLLSFKQFLSMTHPERRVQASPSPTGGFSSFVSSNKETPIFYAMVNGFDDYLRVRLVGRRLIQDLAFAFRRGKQLGEFMMSELKLTNEGGNFQELDADFKAWMASDRRMQKAAKCFGQK